MGGQRRADARRAVAGVLLAALFVGVNWPTSIDDGRTQEREEVIVSLVNARRFGEAELRMEAAAGTQRSDRLFYRVALAFKEHAEPTLAIRWLGRALSATPAGDGVQIGSINYDLAEMHLLAGRPADAIAHLEAARQRGVRPTTSAYRLAEAYRESGQPAQARQVLETVGDDLTPDAAAAVEFAETAMALEDAVTAERFARRAVQLDASNARAHELLGVALMIHGQVEDGVSELKVTTRLAPRNPSGYFHLALALLETRQ